MTTLALDRLVTDVRPVVSQAVDVLHVAAILESRGVTDELAREHYGSEDVFDLAALVRERVATGRSVGPRTTVRLPHPGAVDVPVKRNQVPSEVTWGSSTIGHGAIYLLPALSMPALLALVGTEYVVLALMVGGSVGWVWAAVSTWRAYALWSEAGRAAGARLLRQLTLAGVAVGIGAAAVLVRGLAVPVVVGVVIAAITTAQLGTTLLFFLRRRVLLTVIFLVPASAGAVWLVRPDLVSAPLVLSIFVAAGAPAVAVGAVGLLGPRAGDPDRVVARPPASRTMWVAAYAVASVVFLFLPQAVLLTTEPVAVVALAGLFLAMGVVEWRGARLSEGLRRLLATEHRVGRFRRRTAMLTLQEALLCALVCAASSGLTVYVLDRLGVLTDTAVTMAAAAVPLAAVYLLAMVLANTGAYGWLAVIFGLGGVIEGVAYAAGSPVATAFAAATGVVLVALLVGLTTRPLHRYR
jgi:hypothetical protein